MRIKRSKGRTDKLTAIIKNKFKYPKHKIISKFYEDFGIKITVGINEDKTVEITSVIFNEPFWDKIKILHFLKQHELSLTKTIGELICLQAT